MVLGAVELLCGCYDLVERNIQLRNIDYHISRPITHPFDTSFFFNCLEFLDFLWLPQKTYDVYETWLPPVNLTAMGPLLKCHLKEYSTFQRLQVT
jgi:hypothetical protein